jgi:6-phosphogluconolactonase
VRALACCSVFIFAATTGCSGGDDAESEKGNADASASDASVSDATAIVDASGDAARGPFVAYASGYGPDLSVFAVDSTTGVLTPKSSVDAGDPSPSFLALRPGLKNLYAVGESTMGRVGAYAIDSQGALSYLGGVSSQGNGPAFVSVDPSGAWVLVANYGDGAIAVLPIQADGTLGAPTDTRVAGMNAHMMIADASDKFVFVPCLGSDYVAQFLFDAKTGKLSPNTPPVFNTAAGAGPRHLAFHPNGAYAYLLNETASTITSLSFSSSTGLLTEIETQSTLAADYAGPKNTGAEVAVHPSGKFVYASNRGDDSIAIFSVELTTGKLTPKAHPKTGGTTPRSFTLDPSGAHLYAANQGSNTITSFSISTADGSLTPVGSPISQTMASFIGVAQLP